MKMVEIILKNKIEECYNNDELFKNYLKFKYKDNYKDILEMELNDFILSKHDIYKSNNFKELIYESFTHLNNSRFIHFFRNMLNNHPNANRTYSHMLNDIKDRLDEKYNLNEKYYNMSKYELNKECDKLFLEGKFLLLENTRNYINDTFRLNRYESFVFENRDLGKSILKRNDLDEKDRIYNRIRKMLSKNPGYIGLFTYFNKVEKIGFGRLKTLYLKIKQNEGILNQLPKEIVKYMPRGGVFRGSYKGEDGRTYNTHFENLEDDLTMLIEKHNAKIFADEYPGKIKKDLENNSDFIEIIKELTNGTDKSKEKLKLYRNFWLKKVSRYKTQQELIDSLLNFVFTDSSVESLREQINSNDELKLVFDDGDVIVVRVLSYDAIQEIGSDTSWCIKDSLSYWVDYVYDNNVQLVIIDCNESRTSNERKLGVTLYDGGNFYTAHNVNDYYRDEEFINKKLKKSDITLIELYNLASTLGNNKKYEIDEITYDSYGGI